ncbi:hypothetical protein ABZ905_37080 [Streptomyces parvus]|uniref:hypothetical protein n=1 Tax=Streptomyces parvus TaxID=66428 RepID=UPI0033E88250
MKIAATEVRTGDLILNNYGDGFRVLSIDPDGDRPTFHVVDPQGHYRIQKSDGINKMNVRRA